MKRYYLAALVHLLGLCSFVMVAYGDEQLITSPGSYTAKGGRLSVDVKSPDSQHVQFKVEWRVEETGNAGSKIQHTSSLGPGQFPVLRERWAFCMTDADELWFYDGRRTFLRYRATSNGPESSSGEWTDPKIGEKAPEALKRWASEKNRTIR